MLEFKRCIHQTLTLVARATQAELAQGADKFMRSFVALLHQVNEELHSNRPVLFLTGGMSQATYVIAAVKQVFPDCQFAPANASLGVVDGLAVHASMTQE